MQYIHKVELNTDSMHYIFTNKQQGSGKMHTDNQLLALDPQQQATKWNKYNKSHHIVLASKSLRPEKERKKLQKLLELCYLTGAQKSAWGITAFWFTSLLNFHVLCAHVLKHTSGIKFPHGSLSAFDCTVMTHHVPNTHLLLWVLSKTYSQNPSWWKTGTNN